MLMSSRQPVSSSSAQNVKTQLVRVLNQTRGSTLSARVVVADSPAKRRRGLLGRPPLALDEALWIVPCEAVHTVGMRYPLDLVYLNKRHRVVKTVEALPPWRISLCLRGRSVLECSAGAIRASGTRVGDQLAIAGRD